MLRIDCPFCGKRDHDEFSYEGDASIIYPAIDNTDQKAWYEAVFLRENPRGPHSEYWYHQQGCKMWLIVERNTLTHEIGSVKAARADYAKDIKATKATKANKRSS